MNASYRLQRKLYFRMTNCSFHANLISFLSSPEALMLLNAC